ncbi:class I SAM-dependent methyltransferase [Methanosarcina sp. T3]|uniref:class I SAM-dependent methyltransferase n=1 Tax=Methanosarcina sp. T3 TaxID=3439062 RepID=UPI003F874AA3
MDVSRVTRSKKVAKSSYDRLSKWYDLFASPFEGKFIDSGLQKLQAAPGEIILEIGFGTGQAILELAHAVGNSGRVYGIDLSEKMCEITRAKVEKAGFSKSVQLVNGDALNLPFQGSSFNAIFMSFTLELFDTPEVSMVLKECQRVLKKTAGSVL